MSYGKVVPLLLAFAVTAAGLSASSGLADTASERAQEQQLGAQIYQSLSAQRQIVQTSPYYGVLRSVGNKVLAAAGPQWFHTSFVIIVGNQPNAFSAPGGNVYVTEGLLRSADNKDELANTIGHEVGHLILGHIANRLKQTQHVSFFKKITQKFVHNTGSQNTMTAANAAINYSFLNFTRQQEYAADEEGITLAAKAGFNPWGSVWFFQTIESMYGDAGFEQYVQQHPSTKDRISKIEREIKANPHLFGRWGSTLTVTSGLPKEQSGDKLVLR